MSAPTDADREKAERLIAHVHSGWCGAHPGHQERGAPYAGPCHCRLAGVRDAIAQALADTREEGRQSVGLGDFLPDPCGEETPVPSTWHDAYGYGYLECTLRKGHDGGHEHQESGLTWGAR